MAEPEASGSSGYSNTMAALKARSNRRKQLLAQSLGAASVEDLGTMLASDKRTVQQRNDDQCVSVHSSQPQRTNLGSLKSAAPSSINTSCLEEPEAFVIAKAQPVSDADGPIKEDRKRKRTNSDASSTTSSIGEKVVFDDYYKVLKEDEKIYKGSSTFLKGTQSANPHNDYSQNFVDSGQRPQNFIRDPGLGERFDEYPKLKELIALKDTLALETATKPMYLQADLRNFRLRDLNARFDVILIEPPLAEYQQKAGLMSGQEVWDWDMIESMDIGSVAE
uniref:N(6)-adenosine-methyltransferase non-catalytic subunit METTL14 n=1 Tax=Plectus sambesii TaxID=2011161 RepID=A0A914X4W2_9BILA